MKITEHYFEGMVGWGLGFCLDTTCIYSKTYPCVDVSAEPGVTHLYINEIPRVIMALKDMYDEFHNEMYMPPGRPFIEEDM